MPSIIFSERAKHDLIEVGRYLAEKNPPAAREVVRRIYKTIVHLENYPYFGPLRSELGSKRRYLVVKPYLIIYKILPDDNIRILRIVHGARYLPELV